MEDKIILELCDFLHVTHMTFDCENPLGDSGTPQEGSPLPYVPPPPTAIRKVLLPSPKLSASFWRKEEMTPQCTPEGLSFTWDLEVGGHDSLREV